MSVNYTSSLGAATDEDEPFPFLFLLYETAFRLVLSVHFAWSYWYVVPGPTGTLCSRNRSVRREGMAKPSGKGLRERTTDRFFAGRIPGGCAFVKEFVSCWRVKARSCHINRYLCRPEWGANIPLGHHTNARPGSSRAAPGSAPFSPRRRERRHRIEGADADGFPGRPPRKEPQTPAEHPALATAARRSSGAGGACPRGPRGRSDRWPAARGRRSA